MIKFKIDYFEQNKILTTIGARPRFMKVDVVSKKLKKIKKDKRIVYVKYSNTIKHYAFNLHILFYNSLCSLLVIIQSNYLEFTWSSIIEIPQYLSSPIIDSSLKRLAFLKTLALIKV